MSDRAEAIKKLAQSHAELAIQTLVDVMGDEKAKDAAKVKAADIILQRGFGAPERKVEQKVDVTIVDQRTAHLEAIRKLAAKPKALPDKSKIEDAEFTEIRDDEKDEKK